MKRFFLCLIFLFFMFPANAAFLTGEVDYNYEAGTSPVNMEFVSLHYIDSDSDENLNAIKSGITELKDRRVAKFSDNTYGVIYFDDPEYSWFYQFNGRLVNFTKRESLNYPSKITKYKPDGTVANTGIKISENESYIYDTQGRLIAHWLGEFCYDSKNNIIMKRKNQD